MKIWAKKTFHISRRDKKIYLEPNFYPPIDRPSMYMHFTKDLFYEATDKGVTYIVSDYIVQMILSSTHIDEYFEKEEDRIIRIREEKMKQIL